MTKYQKTLLAMAVFLDPKAVKIMNNMMNKQTGKQDILNWVMSCPPKQSRVIEEPQ